MRVGYDKSGCPDSVSGIARGLIKFDLSDIPAGTSISQAKLYLYLAGYCYYSGHTQARTITLYRNYTDWSSSTTWNNKPATAEASGSGSISVTSFGWRSFDVTGVVRQWVNGTRPNYGLTVRASETSGNEFARLSFATINWTGTSSDPYLQITYTGMADPEDDTMANTESFYPGVYGPAFRDVLGMSPNASDCVSSDLSVGPRACALDER
jgi:hypothetical protein